MDQDPTGNLNSDLRDGSNSNLNSPDKKLNFGKESFKSVNMYEMRKEVSAKIREQYPDRYPVIVELDPKATKKLEIEKKKFLTPGDIRLSIFMGEVRKVIRIGRQEPLAVMVESGHMISGDTPMSELYEQFKDPDGFLYILFSGDI